MFTNEEVILIVEGCEDMELDAVWDYFDKPFGRKYLPHKYSSFDERREAFLWMLKRLLQDGHLKLVDGYTHKPLLGITNDEFIEKFRAVFPKDDNGMRNGIWFFDDACPGRALWSYEGKLMPSGEAGVLFRAEQAKLKNGG
jgi:hypothetical protein